MKWAAWVGVVCCAVGWLSFEARERTPRAFRQTLPKVGDIACPGHLPARYENLTAQKGEAPAALPSVEDNVLMSRLAAQAGELIDQGKTVDAESLIKQLEQETCELTLPESKPLVEDGTELYQKARAGIVIVAGVFKCPRCDNWHASPASGFVIAANGTIVTSHHVIAEKNQKTFVVMTSDGRVFPVARVLAANRQNDLAILQVDTEGLTPLPLGDAVPVGSPVSVLSHPASHFYSLTSGVVSRYTKVHMEGKVVETLQITADYARGSSGAPVLDAQGRVIGVVRSTESIYYSEEGGRQQNLQMVFKMCMPSAGIRKLIGS